MRICLLTVFLCSIEMLGGSISSHLSENSQFSVQVWADAKRKPVVSVFKTEKDGRTLFWSTSFQMAGDYPERSTPYFQSRVSNDGKTVVLFDYGILDTADFVWTLSQDGTKASFTPETVFSRLSIPLNARNGLYCLWPAALSFLIESENEKQFCFWIPKANRWTAINLKTSSIGTPSPPLLRILESRALSLSRHLVEESFPNRPERLALAVRDRAFSVLGIPPALGEFRKTCDISEAFSFLAVQRLPQDRKFLEKLLQAEINPETHCAVRLFPGPLFFAIQYARESGDQLLTIWDNKPEQFGGKVFGMGGFAMSEAPACNYLGNVLAGIYLPYPVPSKAGKIWLYLIPDKIAPTEWTFSKAVVKIACETENRRYVPSASGAEAILVHVGALTPGRYRAKAIWDRRPPFADLASKLPMTPEAGDFESMESNPFEIAAGRTTTILDLRCTYRIGTTDQYYAADQEWIEQNPLSGTVDIKAYMDQRQFPKLPGCVRYMSSPEHE
jgi:hypothetical protein